MYLMSLIDVVDTRVFPGAPTLASLHLMQCWSVFAIYRLLPSEDTPDPQLAPIVTSTLSRAFSSTVPGSRLK